VLHIVTGDEREPHHHYARCQDASSGAHPGQEIIPDLIRTPKGILVLTRSGLA